MNLFYRPKARYGLIALSIALFFLVIGFIGLHWYAASQQSLRLPYEKLMFLSEADLSRNCEIFKWESFCPEYCVWNPSSGQKCGIDFLALKAARSSYKDYLIYLVKKGSIGLDEVAQNETPDIMVQVAEKIPKEVNKISDENVLIETVKNDPGAIRYIEKPSEAVQLAAIQKNGCAIEFIINPTQAILIEAVKRCPTALRYIKNPSVDLLKLAIESHPEAIEDIRNPDKELLDLALEKGYVPEDLAKQAEGSNEMFFELIKKLSPTLSEDQLNNVMRGYFTRPIPLSSGKKPDMEEVKMAIKRDVSQIEMVNREYPGFLDQKEMDTLKEKIVHVVTEPEAALRELGTPNDHDRLMELIFINPYIIKYIDRPTEEAQILAAYLEPNVLQYIKNPSGRLSAIQSLQNTRYSNCSNENPEGANNSLDDNNWIDMFINFKGNMPKDEAIKVAKDNGIRVRYDSILENYGKDNWQLWGSIQKNKAEYVRCVIGMQTTQLQDLQPIY